MFIPPEALLRTTNDKDHQFCLPKGQKRGTTTNDIHSSLWPTLTILRHPAAYFLGSKNELNESGDSDEFQNILLHDDERDGQHELAHLFGKPIRLRRRNDYYV